MEMTIKERINRFCEKYPEPRQCKIILNWNRKDGQHSQEVGTGKDFILWGTRMFSRTVGKPLYIQHYRYDDETELMECAYAVMDCHTPKPDEVRRWKYAERYFVTNEDVYDEKGYRCVYDINGNIGRYVIHNSYGDNVCADARYFLQCFVKLNTMKGYFNEAFTAMSKGNPTLPPRYISENYYSWVMTEWVECADLKGFKYAKLTRNLNNKGYVDESGKLYFYVADMACYADEIQHRLYIKAKEEYDRAQLTLAAYGKMFDNTKLM